MNSGKIHPFTEAARGGELDYSSAQSSLYIKRILKNADLLDMN